MRGGSAGRGGAGLRSSLCCPWTPGAPLLRQVPSAPRSQVHPAESSAPPPPPLLSAVWSGPSSLLPLPSTPAREPVPSVCQRHPKFWLPHPTSPVSLPLSPPPHSFHRCVSEDLYLSASETYRRPLGQLYCLILLHLCCFIHLEAECCFVLTFSLS